MAGALRGLSRRIHARAMPRVVSTNLLTVAVFGAMWIALAGFFFVVVRFILVNEAKKGPGAPSEAEGGADTEDDDEDRRPFEFGL